MIWAVQMRRKFLGCQNWWFRRALKSCELKMNHIYSNINASMIEPAQCRVAIMTIYYIFCKEKLGKFWGFWTSGVKCICSAPLDVPSILEHTKHDHFISSRSWSSSIWCSQKRPPTLIIKIEAFGPLSWHLRKMIMSESTESMCEISLANLCWSFLIIAKGSNCLRTCFWMFVASCGEAEAHDLSF